MSTKKSNKFDLYKLPAIEIYKLVLDSKVLKRFPKGFWQQPEAKENARVIIKYLIDDYLKLSDEEIKQNISVKYLSKYKLGGMLMACFNNSPYQAINLTYPNKFQPWEFEQPPVGYWKNKENIIKATKWFIEDKLKLSDDELKKQLSQNLFKDNGLSGLLYLDGSLYEIINLVYPGKFQPWEFNIVPKGYWKNKENGLKAIKWLIEDKLKLKKDELDKITKQTFLENGLSGMLSICFNNNPQIAIKEYLDKYNV